jgi:hypothetical protein
MRFAAPLLLVLLASPALAHPGHLAESGGHSHFLALMAIAAAIVIAGAGLLRLLAHRGRAPESAERVE